MKISTTLALSTVALASFGGAALAGESQGGQQGSQKNVIEVAREAGNFKTLLTALDAADLTKTLSEVKSVTVFAPTDEAFAKIPQADLQKLLADKEQLKKVLLAHAVGAKLFERTIENVTGAKTLDGSSFAFRQENGKAFIGNAEIISTNIRASNGIIHVIDSVLAPE